MDLDVAQQRQECHMIIDLLTDEKFEIFYQQLQLLVEPASDAEPRRG